MSIGRKNTIAFVNQLELLAKRLDENELVSDSIDEYNAKQYLLSIVKEARELIEYNEWFIGLEHALSILYKVYYQLDNDILKLAENALHSVSKYDEWKKVVEEMRINK